MYLAFALTNPAQQIPSFRSVHQCDSLMGMWVRRKDRGSWPKKCNRTRGFAMNRSELKNLALAILNDALAGQPATGSFSEVQKNAIAEAIAASITAAMS